MKRKAFAAAIIALTLLPGGLAAQFARTYGGAGNESATGILPTPDDGFLIAGTGSLLKLAPDGSLEWARSYAAAGLSSLSSVCATPDGGYLLAGGGGFSIYLVRTDASGAPLWLKSFATAASGTADVFATADGGYGLVGDSVGTNGAWVARLDASGDVISQRSFGLGTGERGRSGAAAPDGGLAVAGVSGSNMAFVFRVEAGGGLSWQKSYVALDYAICEVAAIDRVEGGFVIAGTLANGDDWAGRTDVHGFVYKLGEDGALQWARAVAGAEVRGGWATPDGGIVVTGKDGQPNLFVIKFRPDGEIEFQNAFGGYLEEEGVGAVPCLAGGYAAVGTTRSFGAGETDILAVRVSPEGVLGSCRFSAGAGFSAITPAVSEGIIDLTEEETAFAEETGMIEALDLGGQIESYRLCSDMKLLTIRSNLGIGAAAVTPPLGTHTYAAGGSVTISATSPLTLYGSTYRFRQWEGDVFSTTNPLTLTITDDTTIQVDYDLESPPPPPPDPDSPKGCYIATAAYGTPLDPAVRLLREFRDRRLLTNAIGRSFVGAYYRWSPAAARAIARTPALRILTRALLVPVIAMAFLVLKLGWVPVLLVMAAAMAALVRRRTMKRRARLA